MTLQDVWEWNGTAWQQRLVATLPPARYHAVMAFDPVRRSVLLYGGIFTVGSSSGPLTDTWSWDGVAWQHRFPATPPSFRFLSGAVTDLHRQRIVLHGGRYADGFTWEWDGSEWNMRVQASPGPREGHAMAYDGSRRRTVLFGGRVDSYWFNDTWIFRTPNPADVVPFGTGCAGTAGVPSLMNAPYSLPWLGALFTNRVTSLAPAAAGVVFATGFTSTAPISLAPFGMPGCNQLVIPAVSEFRLATAGAASWTLAIPNTIALANVHLFQQVLALDAAANPLGLTASNGVEITTGIR